MNFENFKLHRDIISGVQALGYREPTPIQEQAIPPVLEGHDVIGLAQTGTGKTAAFVLPILQHLIEKKQHGIIRAAVISPTRELADQTCQAIDQLGRFTHLKSISLYGGVDISRQIQRLRSGPDIAVACPGRLLDHVWKGNIDLAHVEILVIDEADRMLDMGFLPDIKNILRCLPEQRQTLLFSATMPAEVKGLIREILHDPVTVQIGRTEPATTVSHCWYPVKQNGKTDLLMKLLRSTETGSVLVFTRTKHRAESLARQLKQAGFKAASLQGDLSQERRQAAIKGFRNGAYKILVATDIAARGIDVSRISHVINFDMPGSTDDYTHRIGRTGRINKNGDALTFVTSQDGAMIADLEKVLKKRLKRKTLQNA